MTGSELTQLVINSTDRNDQTACQMQYTEVLQMSCERSCQMREFQLSHQPIPFYPIHWPILLLLTLLIPTHYNLST